MMISKNSSIVNIFRGKFFRKINMCMNINEKEALLAYLEMRLLDLGIILENEINSKAAVVFYDNIYDILDDLDDSIDAYLEFLHSSTKNMS